ncbi:hypothetical protein TBLA_0C06500 [Henningerozyma blattae CBS 6284]|uniref:nitric oxide dioxygenase n=1 Tax=Henningerozyma blattae (strain ATCC 34711 / CBS 6284 / DSM 70876 / NBRC 10599 / NRRL Y-10934 / UCD 77-7) TaxID=1071380 RepID=I2H241_HENB6|nr:hypothetical protein TBLA_0C06500 [Tetrapisispora blattae CBS 6284]CCH60443.1 hypothetical protein TBLA_0C06500 [Tetrapisispora blattae CBS 6284]
MLSEETRTIVKATVPALEAKGVEITTTFYKHMLGENSELLDVFNRTNQKKGAQPTALATTVLAAAKNIDDLSPLLPYVRQIGQKHRALQIKPDQYQIVGKYLLIAIKEVLGDAATPEIMNAWKEAYGEIANVFITIEAEMYREQAWPGWKEFKVTNLESVGTNILEVTVIPEPQSNVDLSKLTIVAGQYITVNTHPIRQDNQHDALRHYSICSISTADGIKFAVKLENDGTHPAGLVSEYIHKDLKIGDSIKLSAPAGDFELDEKLLKQNEIPLVLLSGGVGVTPILSMLETQVKVNPNRPICWIQTSYDEDAQAFKKTVNELLKKCSSVQTFYVHTKNDKPIDSEFLKTNVPSHADVYLCGSLEFMKAMINYFSLLNHKSDTVHYEPFGPKMSTITV